MAKHNNRAYIIEFRLTICSLLSIHLGVLSNGGHAKLGLRRVLLDTDLVILVAGRIIFTLKMSNSTLVDNSLLAPHE